ncbi:FAD-dependent oxidoreductase [Humitalea sp. 24SJ18S-53]|uniref:FAD-dependent oxidoreductase n=1 Tax=Humitalea sp. 24SJ18S-53 TaxID=3422307 RepID=UPI003D670B33
MTRHDVIVLGAGPAGVAAAIEAASRGRSTLLIDEAPAAGGQVFRAPAASILRGPPEPGAALRATLAASGVRCLFDRRVWFLAPGFRVACVGPEGQEEHTAGTLILASGAQERVLPVPGWTLPGVIGLAAATVLLKSQKILPGRRVVVAGTGPLLLLVAATILAGGGQVAAMVDAADTSDWLRLAPHLAARPDLLARGLGWAARVKRAGVPVLRGHAVARVLGDDGVTAVEVVPLHGGPARRFDADALCLGHGLLPATEATRLLRAEHRHDPALGGWVPVIDALGRTSVPGLFACGDGAGVLGADAAPLTGRLAALGACGLGVADAEVIALTARLARTRRFGAAMTRIATPPAALLDLATPDTILCRCEGLRRAELEPEIDAGAVTLTALKAATRCGMGPCGGRYCAEAAAMLIAARTGRSREAIGPGTGRPPLRPVPIDLLAGDFDYDSLPIPAPAPL